MNPLLILVLSVGVLIFLILRLRIHAFIALIATAMLVSLLAPGAAAERISRVAAAFGDVVGSIGIVIALAAIIGKCLMGSGAADRIVQSILKALGEKQAATALLGSGFILSIPVFFDTVFYLLVPLARSMSRRTGRSYVLYVTAICAGAAITHTLVPPTPGPLFIADAFGVDLGLMMGIGVLVAIPAAFAGLLACKIMDKRLQIPMRPYADEEITESSEAAQLPSLFLSLLPVLLPVILITGNTVAATADAPAAVQNIMKIIGNPNLALLFSTMIALYLLVANSALSFKNLSIKIDSALMSGGVIILVTAGGGAFGAMLRAAGLQDAVKGLISFSGSGAGIIVLLVAGAVAALLKFAQGSSTVAMITSASMFAAMGFTAQDLGFNLVYLALAIGGGSLIGSWMNDSGFWIFSRMGVFTEEESLKTWSVLLVCLGISSMIITLVLAFVFPLI